jgi:hypothetical protein
MRSVGTGAIAVIAAMALGAACNASNATSDPHEASDGGAIEDSQTSPPSETGTVDGDIDPWLRTQGNAILESDGTRFHGRGANIPDPRGCDACLATPSTEEENRRIDELVAWGANFIRLGLQNDPKGSDAAYFASLKEVIQHASSRGIYTLMSIWIDPTKDGNDLPTAATKSRWQTLATTFAAEPRVLFGITNEPVGASDEAVWNAMNDTARVIREAETTAGGKQHIVVVQGTQNFGRQLAYYTTHPITAGGGANIAYETHIYDPPSEFDALLVTPSKTLPVILGEFGPVNTGGASVKLDGTPAVTVANCMDLMDLARSLEIPHLGFTFHMRCPPNLLVDTSGGTCGLRMELKPTADWGTAFKAKLATPW